MLTALASLAIQSTWIHSISDISHEFTFYMDGRFHRQYIGDEGGRDARNWGTLHKLDLTNVNLLALSGNDHHVPYDAKSIRHVRRYVEDGGGLLIMADGNAETVTRMSIQAVAREFGARFVGTPAQGAPKAVDPFRPDKIELRRGGTLALNSDWKSLIVDEAGGVLLARRKVGKGNVLVSVRGLFGSNPDASDNINAAWIKPLLASVASGKTVDRSRPPQGQFAELTRQVGPLTLEFHEGTAKFAEDISREYKEIRPHLVAITGVEPAPGMITRMLMLPTGGGGFSSGERIAIGTWWGDYPTHRYPMVELIGHEAGHSWVLPYPEPVWNEPIATYLGIEVGRRMKMPEADETLRRAVEAARKLDPEFKTIDLLDPKAPNAVVWGKTFYIFEELEKKIGPGAMAKYFRAKRQLAKPGRPTGYSMHDCVAVWSNAAGRDLFPWFRSLGMSVDKSKVVDIPMP